LSNFSKEFYHWLVVGYNEAQRCCVMESCDFYKRGISVGNSEVGKKATSLSFN
jgi:hypothetical protein